MESKAMREYRDFIVAVDHDGVGMHILKVLLNL